MVSALSVDMEIVAVLPQMERLEQIRQFTRGWSGSMGKTLEGHQITFLSFSDCYTVTISDAPTKHYSISSGLTALGAQLEMMEQDRSRPAATCNEYSFKLDRNAQPIEGVLNSRFVNPGLVDNFLRRVVPDSIGPYSDA
jgi:hypothetical protein